jgi:hypothetical protein
MPQRKSARQDILLMAQIVVSTKCRGEIVMLKITYTAQLASLLLVVGWFAFSGTTAEAVADTAPGQQASLEGSNAQGASAADQAMELKTDGIKCVRQMPRYRPAPDFLFKC